MKEAEQLITAEENQDDETDIRESGPLESNDPKSSTGKIETSQSASLTQRQNDVVEQL